VRLSLVRALINALLPVIAVISCSDTEFGDESGDDPVEEVYSVSEKLDSKEEDVGGAVEEEEIGGIEEEEGEADDDNDDNEASDSDNDDLTKLVATLQSVVDSESEQARSTPKQYTTQQLSLSLEGVGQVPSVGHCLVCSSSVCLPSSLLCVHLQVSVM